MTTICAVKKGKSLCIASDSLALFGSRKEITGKHVYDGKIIQIGPNFVGFCGHPSWELILNHFFSKKKSIAAWETADQIFETLNTLHHYLKNYYFFSPPPTRHVPLESSEWEFLIINSHGIFDVDYQRALQQYKYFFATGTGSEYALGAIKAVYNLIDDPQEIAKIGIEAAAQFDGKTALPFHTHCISAE